MDNLSAQRKAILGWKISTLIERIESREALLLSLGAVEERRQRITSQLSGADAQLSLREILSRTPSSEQTADLTLRERVEDITANLQGPILLNPASRQGLQLVVEQYPLRHPLISLRQL